MAADRAGRRGPAGGGLGRTLRPDRLRGYAPRPERLRRVSEARGWSDETFAARERSQSPLEDKLERADWIIANDGGPDTLGREVDRLLDWLHAGTPPEPSPAASLALSEIA